MFSCDDSFVYGLTDTTVQVWDGYGVDLARTVTCSLSVVGFCVHPFKIPSCHVISQIWLGYLGLGFEFSC